MLSLLNTSDVQLVNRPKMAVFDKFYNNQGESGKMLHSTQLDRSTNEHSTFQRNPITVLAKVYVYRHQTDNKGQQQISHSTTIYRKHI